VSSSSSSTSSTNSGVQLAAKVPKFLVSSSNPPGI
jgi:hypothetical protein